MSRQPGHNSSVPAGLLLLAACNGDAGLTKFDAIPDVTVTSPAEGATVSSGAAFELRGSASDVDDAASSLMATWIVDDTPVCTGAVAADGVTTCIWVPQPGAAAVQLQVVDPDGAVGIDNVNVTGTADDPPVVTLTSPLADDVYTYGATVTLAGSIADAEDGPEGLDLTWTDNGDTLTIDTPVQTDGAFEAYASFDPGDHVLMLAAADSRAQVGSDSVAFTVLPADAPPSAPVVALQPAGTDDDLIVTVTTASVDPEGAPVTYRYAWLLDGVTSGASTSATLDHAATTRGDVWTARVTPTDGTSDGPPAEASTTIGNTAPVLAGVTILPDPPTPTDTLTCTPATPTDADGDTVSLTYGWEVNGAAVAPTTTTLAPGYFVQGDSVRCLVTPDDGIDAGATVASPPVVIGNNAPVATAVSLTPTSPATDDIVTALPTATDPDGDTLTWTYAWYVDGVVVRAVTGATLSGSLYFAHGQLIEVEATPNDGYVDGPAARSAAITVVNTTPTGTTVTLSPSSPRTNDVLTATPTGSDLDGDVLTWTYTWYRNGTPLGASGDTLNGATWFARGDVIDVEAVPTDGADAGAAVRSAAVTVVNTLAGAPVVEIQPVEPIEGADALRCVITAAAVDADGDPVTSIAAWTVDSAPFAGTTSTTFPNDTVGVGVTVAGEAWTCTVSSSDGHGAAPDASDTVIILGDPVDYGHVQFPCSASVAGGATFDVYGWVYEPAVTVGPGMGLGIDAEAGVGPDASHPAHDPGWVWTPATYHGDKDAFYPGDVANDEYVATLTAPGVAGAYDYAYRFSTDGGLSWVYADLGGDTCLLIGTTDGYEPTTAGALTVY